MTDFISKKLTCNLCSHAGLHLLASISRLLAPNPDRFGFSDPGRYRQQRVLKSYIALLSLGKSDFAAIGSFRDNDFFKRAPDLTHAPSSPKLLSTSVAGKPINVGDLDRGYTDRG